MRPHRPRSRWTCPRTTPQSLDGQAPGILEAMPASPAQRTIIAPSVLAADFSRLADELDSIGNADWVHLDVMDGHFVPNLSFGLPVCSALRPQTDKHLDVHLMIDDPQRWAKDYADFDSVTFHLEAVGSVEAAVALAAELRSRGTSAGVAIKPGTPVEGLLEHLDCFDLVLVMSVEPGFGGQEFMPEVLGKVQALRERIDADRLSTLIEIDGGIKPATAGVSAQAGVDVYVAGSSVFAHDDRRAAIDALRDSIGDALTGAGDSTAPSAGSQ